MARVGTSGNVPIATRNPANGRITSLGIGGTPKLSTTMRAKRPGRPTTVRIVTMIWTTVPTRENVTTGPAP
jgi:hypothetical protein